LHSCMANSCELLMLQHTCMSCVRDQAADKQPCIARIIILRENTYMHSNVADTYLQTLARLGGHSCCWCSICRWLQLRHAPAAAMIATGYESSKDLVPPGTDTLKLITSQPSAGKPNVDIVLTPRWSQSR
jgi:hypothetical protein